MIGELQKHLAFTIPPGAARHLREHLRETERLESFDEREDC